MYIFVFVKLREKFFMGYAQIAAPMWHSGKNVGLIVRKLRFESSCLFTNSVTIDKFTKKKLRLKDVK